MASEMADKLVCQRGSTEVVVGGTRTRIYDCGLIADRYHVRFGVGESACTECQGSEAYEPWRRNCAMQAYAGCIIRNAKPMPGTLGRDDAFARLAALDRDRAAQAVLAALAARSLELDEARGLLASARIDVADDRLAAAASAQVADPRRVAVEPAEYSGACQDRARPDRIRCRRIAHATGGIGVAVHDGICRRCRDGEWWRREAVRCLVEAITRPPANLPEMADGADRAALIDARVRALVELAGKPAAAAAIAAAYLGAASPYSAEDLRAAAERHDLIGVEVPDAAR